MLRKLVKYDLRFLIGKELIVYYIISMVVAVLTRIFLSFEDSAVLHFIGLILNGVTISALCSTIINAVIRCWVRFSRNFYHDESYLTHTLPVTKKMHYAAKVISSALTLVISLVVCVLAVVAGYFSKENFEIFKSMFLPFAQAMNESIWLLLLLLGSVLLIELMVMVQAGFTGALVGHRFGSGKGPLSVLFGGIAYVVYQSFSLLLMFLYAVVLNDELLDSFTSNAIVDLATFKEIMYCGLLIYALLFAIGYFINQKLFQKGVNVD